ncbi:MAG: hypothetical protein J6M07_01365 [Ruminococcus sp.]|nr:hypothetical protein [Ruminococcus sp.]
MKQPKRPTRSQKELLEYYHLKPENWLVRETSPDELTVVHRFTGTVRTLAAVEISSKNRRK